MALHRVLYHLTAETLMIYSLTVNLHWLLIKYQIEYKIAVIVYSVVNTQEPSCLADVARFHALSPHLRSSNRNLLQKDRTNLEFTDHSFSHAAPTVWNNLPQHAISDLSTLTTFKRLLKTKLHKRTFYC